MNHKKNTTYLIVFLISFLWLLLGSNIGINIYDEGIGIVGAMRVLHSEIPYTDFWTVYSPGWYYIQAGFMSIFGESLIILRILTVFISSATIVMLFKLLESQSIKPYFVSLAALMFLSISPAYGRALPLALLLLVTAVYFLLNYKSNKDLIALGILTFFLFTVRHDFAVYFSAATVVYMIFEKLLISRNRDFKIIYIFAGSTFAFISIYLLILAGNGMLGEYVNQSYIFVFKNFSATRNLPFPNPIGDILNPEYSIVSKIFKAWESTVFYVPFLSIAIGFYLIKIRRIALETEGKLFIAAMLLTLFLTTQAITRSDLEHILPSLLISLLLVPIFMRRLNINNKYLLFGILLLITLPPVAKKLQTVQKIYLSDSTIEVKSDKADYILLPMENGTSYNNLLEFITIHCKEKYLYSGTLKHDRIYINDVMLYYLTDKQPAVEFHELHPRQATEAKEQAEIIKSLKEKNVSWLVLFSADFVENNSSSLSSEVYDLDNFIKQNYQLKRIFGHYFVFEKFNR